MLLLMGLYINLRESTVTKVTVNLGKKKGRSDKNENAVRLSLGLYLSFLCLFFLSIFDKRQREKLGQIYKFV